MRFLFIIAVLFFISPANSQSAQGTPPTVTYAIGPPSIPLYELEPCNEIGWKGLFIEIVEEIFAKELGNKLVIEQYPWKRAQQNVKEGNAVVEKQLLVELTAPSDSPEGGEKSSSPTSPQ